MIDYKVDSYKPDYVLPPGASLAEALQNTGMSQAELATRTARPLKTINEIINGITEITPETAIQFERVLGIHASFWINLEKNYQENKARLDSEKLLVSQIELTKNYPYNEMFKLGWIPLAKSYIDKAKNLLNFFGVTSLELVPTVIPIAFRQHDGKNISKESLAVWLRKGEIEAGKIETADYDRVKLEKLLPEIIKYSTKDPTIISVELRTRLAECGISLVFTQYLSHTYICGATRWLNPKKALLQLSLKGRFADVMWFTLYHELAHIIYHAKRMRFIELSINNKNTEDVLENEADKFAIDNIISKVEFERFLSGNSFSKVAIVRFANSLDIHPGIVVGRLQHENLLKYNEYFELRNKYQIKSSSN